MNRKKKIETGSYDSPWGVMEYVRGKGVRVEARGRAALDAARNGRQLFVENTQQGFVKGSSKTLERGLQAEGPAQLIYVTLKGF